MRLVGISGSLRQDSYSTIILKAIVEMIKPQAVFELLDIGVLPHYNGDLEKEVLPKAVTDARALVQQSDGVLVVCPEFNHGIPGVLKNTLDWLSRPAFNSCFYISQSILLLNQQVIWVVYVLSINYVRRLPLCYAISSL